LEALRAITPPWVVSLPAQVAAVRALQDSAYYGSRYQEKGMLREHLTDQLAALGRVLVSGQADFFLCHLPEDGPPAANLVVACRHRELFLRDASAMGSKFGPRAIRVAVKDNSTSERMVRIIERCCQTS